MTAVRVLIADDHPAFRAGLRLMLADAEEVEVVGEAATGAAAVQLATELRPDVVIMDLRMPEVDGIEATRRLLRTDPTVGVVVVTMFEDDDAVFAAMRAGPRGYLLKGAEQEEILRAIRAIAAGEAIFGPPVAAPHRRAFLPRRRRGAQLPDPHGARTRGAGACRRRQSQPIIARESGH